MLPTAHWTAALAILAAFTATPALPAKQAGLSAPALAAVNQARALDQSIEDWAMQLWQYSEIALEEQRSAAYLASQLQREGFRVKRGVAGLPTAFIAEWGSGQPVIGFTAEYDALPGIGNEAVPRRQQRADGHPHGHGCGHNLFGAGATGAAIALKRAMQQEGIGGTLRVYGSPAEETLVGKVYMAKDGLFDDLDVALDWHPLDATYVSNTTGQAMNNFTVEFFGKAAHGAFDPWNGRSALDAVELMSVSVNMMREHIRPSARIHSVVTHGGEAPNVVPAYARAWYYVRDNDRDRVEQHYRWLLDIAEAAALATQTTHKVSLVTGVHEMLLNRPLQEAMQNNLEAIGGPRYNEAEQAFARELQTFLEQQPLGLATDIKPLEAEPGPVEGGSTDVAEISWIAPTVSLYVASAGSKLPWHSWATSASHGRPGAARAAQVAARVLAATGMDLLTRPELLAAAQADFLQRTGGASYQSPIPADQAPPLPATDGEKSDSAGAANKTSDETAELVQRAGAPLLEGLGEFTYPVTTSEPWAQRYFDQGMIMAAGFNHAEAIRAFRAAQRLDPDCAMCYWGEALATGPNINVTSKGKAVMQPAQRVAAFAAINTASDLAQRASPREQALIAAQKQRYNGDPDSDRDPLDLAYAAAMRKLAQAYPDDDDIQAMFAEAMMNTMPWDYWLDADNAKPGTREVITALERVMARNPSHPLALHLYIHAVEASSNPGRAEQAADRLADLVPGSGHLVHMPSHIYWRVGRYHDASEANVRAAQVDEDYIAQCNAQGFYPALYYPHNIHFLWASASMEGRSAIAIEAGEKLAANVRLEQIRQFPTIEFFKTVPLLSLVRFGRWEDILRTPAPAAELAFSNAIWHYARAVALARQGDLERAASERAALEPLLENPSVWLLDGNDYPASHILGIARYLVDGELAQARGDFPGAIAAFTSAVELQDTLPYTEPPFWYYPTRQSLGKALLESGNPAAAETVYRADLAQYPRNGWSLFGLSLSLEAQGKQQEAALIRKRHDNIWGRADVTLNSSVL